MDDDLKARLDNLEKRFETLQDRLWRTHRDLIIAAGLLYFMLALGLGEKHFPAVLGASIVALIALVLAAVFRKDDSQDQ